MCVLSFGSIYYIPTGYLDTDWEVAVKKVNALTIRNKLGSILDGLDSDGEPILVSKGRQPRAVIISIKDFKERFIDRQSEEDRRELMRRIEDNLAEKTSDLDSLQILRQLRGYKS
jgi:prevent-host-death family protein